MRQRDGVTAEITPPDAYVRTLVHEYGGGSWWVHDGVAFYVDVSDQRLRRLVPGRSRRSSRPSRRRREAFVSPISGSTRRSFRGRRP